MHGAYTGAQFIKFKLVQKNIQKHNHNENKNNIQKKTFPGQPASRACGAGGLPHHQGGGPPGHHPGILSCGHPFFGATFFDANFHMIFVDILAAF
jgi:hypothetical protein